MVACDCMGRRGGSGGGRGGSLLARRLHVFSVAFKVWLDYKLVQKRCEWLKSEDAIAERWERAHERNAERVYEAICNLEGLWVKAGQYLSTRADVLPDVYIQRLRLLQDTLPPRKLEEVFSTIQAELREAPSKLFAHFDNKPLATASIAQVHRARMADGREVVVKVQHQGVRERILQDLHNLRSIVEWVAWSDPQYNFQPVVDEWANEVPKELDFVTEAENTRTVAANLSHRSKRQLPPGLASTAVDVLVPEVVQATERVLVLQYMDGVRLSDKAGLAALGVDKQALVETITRAYAHQIYVDGFFNADPHPGNFLVSKDAPHLPILLDFGLTKILKPDMKRSLAKMLLAVAEMDLVSLLSSFEEMGLRLNRDMPDDALRISGYFFRKTAPPEEARSEFARYRQEREERLKQWTQGEDKGLGRNPVDAFPSDAVFFLRVLNLLRGLSSSLDARVVYLEIMRPFAEASLFSEASLLTPQLSSLGSRAIVSSTPVRSQLDTKLRQLLQDLWERGLILGMQVCVYKGGEVVVDCCGGVLGRYDPRPVQSSSLFPCFSVTKGVTAALLHCLADTGRIDFGAPVSSVWPSFGANGKEGCTIAHIATHRAGLSNAGARTLMTSPFTICDWKQMLAAMEATTPETLPGEVEQYHYLSFGWLAGGVVEGGAGSSFAEALDTMIVRPLGLQGECYVGIPPGVESRLATLAVDQAEIDQGMARFQTQTESQPSGPPAEPTEPSRPAAGPTLASPSPKGPSLPARRSSKPASPAMAPAGTSEPLAVMSSDTPIEAAQPAVTSAPPAIVPNSPAPPHVATNSPSSPAVATNGPSRAAAGPSSPLFPSGTTPPVDSLKALPLLFNALQIRRACVPSANGHFSARALARLYATLAAGGGIPHPDPLWEEEREGGAETSDGAPVPKAERPGGKGEPAKAKVRREVDDMKGRRERDGEVQAFGGEASEKGDVGGSLFSRPDVIDAMTGVGDYSHLALPSGKFGLGFVRFRTEAETKGDDAAPKGAAMAFGHNGLGGSTAFCDPKHNFSIAVTVNKLSVGAQATMEVVRLVCSELGVELPQAYSPAGSAIRMGM